MLCCKTRLFSFAECLSVCLPQVALLGKASSVAAGANHSLALRSEYHHEQKRLLTVANAYAHKVTRINCQDRLRTNSKHSGNGDVCLETQRGWRNALGLGQQRAWYDTLPYAQTLELLILPRQTRDSTMLCSYCSRSVVVLLGLITGQLGPSVEEGVSSPQPLAIPLSQGERITQVQHDNHRKRPRSQFQA